MTIDEAVEGLAAILHCYVNEQEWKAIQLGIEALKLVKELRECMPGAAARLLPGETKGDA